MYLIRIEAGRYFTEMERHGGQVPRVAIERSGTSAQYGQRAFKSIQKVGEIGHFAACAVQELVLS